MNTWTKKENDRDGRNIQDGNKMPKTCVYPQYIKATYMFHTL